MCNWHAGWHRHSCLCCVFRSPLYWTLRCLRPHDTLVFLRNGSDALIDELLHALAAACFGGKDVAFRVGGNAMHGIKLTRLPSAIAKARQRFERIALADIHAVVRA